ncbi:MAG: hypothetical protein DRO11_03010 [Methanobacteriota archaeon]|nr:MAG: hypothetical protein DRO11_03010 [Euryarchaeota archaeon]
MATKPFLRESSQGLGDVNPRKKIVITGSKVLSVGYRLFLLEQADNLQIDRFEALNKNKWERSGNSFIRS